MVLEALDFITLDKSTEYYTLLHFPTLLSKSQVRICRLVNRIAVMDVIIEYVIVLLNK